MPFLPLALPPGVYRNGTPYQGRPRWRDADGVRWIDGTLRPIGGWAPLTTIAGSVVSPVVLSGVPRDAVAWRTTAGAAWLGVGTTTNLYAYTAGTLVDITPAGLVPGAANASSTGTAAYGVGPYGLGLYGVGSAASEEIPPDTWQLDTFGNFLVGVLTSDGRLLSWDANPATDAVVVSGAPTANRGVVVTNERFVFALGAGGNGKRVQWADQETLTVWTPTASNSAGDFDLATNGRLVCGRRGRQQTLLWTDVDLHTATFVGGEFVYSFALAGENCGVIGPNAVAMDNGVAYWMGSRAFYVYDGFVRVIPCDVSDFVFSGLNTSQRAKVFAHVEPEFSEIWWFYPSSASVEIDRYVVYNYRENHWTIGSMARTAGVSRGVFTRPILFSATGAGFEHEAGTMRTGLSPFVESGPIELGRGDQVATVRAIIPDERTVGQVRARVLGRLYPTAPDTMTTLLVAGPKTDVRFTARQMTLRLTEATPNTDWRIGEYRLDLVTRGQR